MNEVPRDGTTMGEVMFRGNLVMKGYLKNPTATREAFEHGWFHSGDLGVMHEDGYIELRDRSKDIIISGGENISTIEVEGVIIEHPAVANVAVVAKPDEKWGETPCAFVVLKPGASATADDIVAHCRANLASYKCPRYVVFRDLPMTSTGKVQKFVLREWAKQVSYDRRLGYDMRTICAFSSGAAAHHSAEATPTRMRAPAMSGPEARGPAGSAR